MKSILDPTFKYTHSSKTDVRKTIRAYLKKQKELKEAQDQVVIRMEKKNAVSS